ncbi:MAG: translation initiation factor 6 [Candidatus Altiarchaeales archaeon ex4484_96]|nr:MAG: translation initiation factor 6 [Candidatus Altiarchaeales archaeon ex4484_96]
MHLGQISVDGEDFIGLMGFSTDGYAITSPKLDDVDVLGVPSVSSKLYGTNFVGLFCAGNSRGLLLPHFVCDATISLLKDFFSEKNLDVEVGVLSDKYTAVGNLIACNDNAALISPLIDSVKRIEDVLGVEVHSFKVGDHLEVGSCCVVTNRGFLAHPDAADELHELSDLFKVSGNVGSVNFGIPYIKSGIIANSRGYLVGSKTTGIEIGRIDEALGFLDED